MLKDRPTTKPLNKSGVLLWGDHRELPAPLVGFRLLGLGTASRFGSPDSSPNIAPAFNSQQKPRRRLFVVSHNQKTPEQVGSFLMGRPPGIEPGSGEPQSPVLTVTPWPP